jgi:7-keto-8-aminopelargonate synthetase-like enzyme
MTRLTIFLKIIRYLGLIGHKNIEDAAISAIRKYGTGSGVRDCSLARPLFIINLSRD